MENYKIMQNVSYGVFAIDGVNAYQLRKDFSIGYLGVLLDFYDPMPPNIKYISITATKSKLLRAMVC